MHKLEIINPIPDNLNINSKDNSIFQKNNLNKIISHRALTNKAKLTFPGYSNQANKIAIYNLSFGCCGYCGLRINSTQTETVEHYRPKAELHFKKNYLGYEDLSVNEENRKNKYKLEHVICDYGYFKWGDDINNLLPACECCNTGQGRNSSFIAKKNDKSNIENYIPYGKKNLFPIWLKKKPDYRIGKEYISDIHNEFSLLFNPLIDDPNDYFEYKDAILASGTSASIVKIRPKKKLSKKLKTKAIVSIIYFGLNRYHLCITRGEYYDNLKTIEDSLYDLIDDNENEIYKWCPQAREVGKIFSRENSQLLGYTTKTFGHIVDILHSELLLRFPIQSRGILNSNSLFHIKADELFDFHRQNFNNAEQQRKERRKFSSVARTIRNR